MNDAVLPHSSAESAPQPVDWRAHDEIEEAIERLYFVVWDRWHPENDATREQAPKLVYDALADLRPLVLEIEGLWKHLGLTLRRDA